METVSETGVSNDCQTNPELSDKQKKRSGKKKRKSRKPEDELKNNDSHISSQIGNADEAFSSQEKKEGEEEKSTSEDHVQLSENLLSSLPAESCQRDSISCEEPGATLYHTDPVICEDSLPDANRKVPVEKKSKRREKKKTEDASCDEKMLVDAEKITNKDQVHPPNNPLSNGIIQEGSHEHTQDSSEKPGAAQLCTDPNLSTCEDSQPDATNMTSSPKKKRKKKRGRIALKESGADTYSTNAEVAVKYNSITEAEGSRSMSVEENSIASNLGKAKEKETDENTEVKEDVLGAGVCDVRSKKRKRKKKKASSADHKTADMEVCEPSGSVECLLDPSNEKVMQNCDENGRKEFGGEDKTSKIEESATREKSEVQKSGKRKEMTKDENIESNQDALGAEDIASKDLASNIEDSASKGESVQGVKNTKKKKKDKKGKVDQDALGAEDVSKVEVTTKKSKKKKILLDHKTDNMEEDSQKEIENKGEVDQNALGAEGVSKVEVKTKMSKKKKNSLDNKTDDMEEKDDVSLPSKDAESEFDREKLETSLSSSVLIQNNVAQVVASSETGDVPRCSCAGQRTRKLVVFDLNGILADIVQGFTGPFVPDGKVSYRSGKKESISMWSLDQNKCTTTKFKTQENNDKPLFLKDLRTVWDGFGTCTSCGKRKYDETTRPCPHTGIPYQFTDRQDSALGREGELRKYLERLADAEKVQKFVAENPFGQTAITETHESWEFYSKVVEAHKRDEFKRIGLVGSINKIGKTEGLMGFYRGNGASVARIVPYAALHYMAYEEYRRWIIFGFPDTTRGPLLTLLTWSGQSSLIKLIWNSAVQVVGSAKAQVKAIPLDQIVYRGIVDCFSRAYTESGFRGLYRGVAPSLYAIFPYAGLKFYFYEEMKCHVPAEHKKDISLKLVCGSVAGLLGQTLTYPLNVVRRKCRLRDYIQPLRKIQEEEQCKPFSRLQEKKVVPSLAIGFTVYDIMKLHLRVPPREEPEAEAVTTRKRKVFT
ncbi:unnamed protein product [Arabidopsis arenosa]|uniref:Uncharacterized protein n=1 Tax=Arabidopsis arenosa TaxID=38785 RepID=A0A8S2A0C5_ARAAE|nr:unnamed protein product [Arabidopsis arenosa]